MVSCLCAGLASARLSIFDPRAWEVALRASRSEFRDLRRRLGRAARLRYLQRVELSASSGGRVRLTVPLRLHLLRAKNCSALRDRHLTP